MFKNDEKLTQERESGVSCWSAPCWVNCVLLLVRLVVWSVSVCCAKLDVSVRDADEFILGSVRVRNQETQNSNFREIRLWWLDWSGSNRSWEKHSSSYETQSHNILFSFYVSMYMFINVLTSSITQSIKSRKKLCWWLNFWECVYLSPGSSRKQAIVSVC